MKHEWRVTIKNNTMAQSTIEIVEQSVTNILMLSGWLVHELRQLANCISNIRVSGCDAPTRHPMSGKSVTNLRTINLLTYIILNNYLENINLQESININI